MNKNSKSIDTVGLNTKMISIAMQSEKFLISLTNMYNYLINFGYVPEQFKVSRIVVLPKSSNVSTPASTRPIAIQPILTKY